MSIRSLLKQTDDSFDKLPFKVAIVWDDPPPTLSSHHGVPSWRGYSKIRRRASTVIRSNISAMSNGSLLIAHCRECSSLSHSFGNNSTLIASKRSSQQIKRKDAQCLQQYTVEYYRRKRLVWIATNKLLQRNESCDIFAQYTTGTAISCGKIKATLCRP